MLEGMENTHIYHNNPYCTLHTHGRQVSNELRDYSQTDGLHVLSELYTGCMYNILVNPVLGHTCSINQCVLDKLCVFSADES